jgi:hypothetical protein
MSGLIRWILGLGLSLLIGGGLVEATRQLMSSAADAHQNGRVSLSKLNRQLWSK